MSKLTHINAKGEARMVDVSGKPVQLRAAMARGEIRMTPATLKLVREDKIAKGDARNSFGQGVMTVEAALISPGKVNLAT